MPSPVPPEELPLCPDWLDDESRREWSRVAPELGKLGLLTRVDVAALAAYCQCYSQWRAASLQLQTDGLTSVGSQGQVRIHPLAVHVRDLLTQLRAYAAEFGFTPSARGRLSIAPPNAERDAFEDFLCS